MADRRVSVSEMQRRQSWLQKTRLSITAVKNRCRVIHEARFPDNFEGLYSARFSKSGDIIAAGFGTGGIQV